jgi:integrase
MQAVTVPLAEAKRLGKIQVNPAVSIRRLRESKPARHILTLQEAAKLFARDWPEPRQKAINMLAAITGMRLGECLGLQVEDIKRREIQLGEK